MTLIRCFTVSPAKVPKKLRASKKSSVTARQRWLKEAKDAKVLAECQKSEFLCYRNHTNRVADFHSLRHTFITNLANGAYDVVATATDLVGNVGADTTQNELTIDGVAPVITVTPKLTSDTTPGLAGTVNDPNANIRIQIGAQAQLFIALNNGDGTWSLPDNLIGPLANGTYDVIATATDFASNVGTDATQNELTIDAIAPIVTIDPLVTSDATPPLTGTVNDPNAVVLVTISDVTYPAVNDGEGGWSVPDGVIGPLPNDTYDVTVQATDTAGNNGVDDTTDELVVNVQGENQPPQFTFSPVTGATEDSQYQYNITTQDADEDALSIFAGPAGLPAWLNLVDNGDGTATLSGTPTNSEVGQHNVTLLVSDGQANTPQNFTITVTNTNDDPFFTSTPVTEATEGQAYLYEIVAADPDDGDAVFFQLSVVIV